MSFQNRKSFCNKLCGVVNNYACVEVKLDKEGARKQNGGSAAELQIQRGGRL